MSHEIAGITRCRICNKAFVGPSIALIGVPAQQGRLSNLLEQLTQHLHTTHRQVMNKIQMDTHQFTGLQLLRQYTTSDDEMKQQRELLRWAVHQATLNARISDENLEKKTDELTSQLVDLLCPPHGTISEGVTREARTEAYNKILAVVSYLRDQLEEPGKYDLSHPVTVKAPLEPPKRTM